MKHLIAILFLFFSVTSNAQIGFFIEGGANLISINQDAGVNVNVSGNVLIAKKFYVGAFYERVVTNHSGPFVLNSPVPGPGPITIDTSLYYSQSTGIKTGFIILPNRLVSISPEVHFGWTNFFWESARSSRNQYLNITPSLKVSFKLAKVFRIGLSANYRYYSELSFQNNLPSISSQRLSGLGGGLFLRVGKF